MSRTAPADSSPQRDDVQILAFQAALAGLDTWPETIPMDRFSLDLIVKGATRAAQTVHLIALANI